MPDIQSIEQFKQQLNSIGDEPAILAERGEQIENIEPPEEGLPADLDELLGGAAEDVGEAEEAEEAEEPEEAEEIPDFEEVEEEPAEKAGEAVEAEETEEPEAEEELELEPEGEPEPEEEFESFDSSELGTAEELDSLPDDFQFGLPEEGEPGEGVEEQAGEEAEELPDFEELGEEEAGEAAGEEPEEFGELGEEDFDLGIPEEPAEEEFETGEAPAADFGEEEEEGEEEEAGEATAEETETEEGEEFGELGELEETGLDDEDFSFDEFSLEGIGDEFGITSEEGAEELAPFAAEESETTEEAEEAIEEAEAAELSLSDQDFLAVKRTLAGLPRNLKLAIEELVGEEELGGERLSKLTTMLIEGESPKALAAYVGRITGKTINIPRGYERKSTRELEEEQQTFGYFFRTRIFPVLRTVLILAVIGVLLFVLGRRFIYAPIMAKNLYEEGYEYLLQEEPERAESRFVRATERWARPHGRTRLMRKWYYRYAQGYTDTRQYDFAEHKYLQIISGMSLLNEVLPEGGPSVDPDIAWRKITERYANVPPELNQAHPDHQQFLRNPAGWFPPFSWDRLPFIELGRLESRYLAKYDSAESLFTAVLEEDYTDYDGLILSGDNYLRWARSYPADTQTALEKYDQARRSYAELYSRHGGSSKGYEIQHRLLYYFISADRETDGTTGDLDYFSSILGIAGAMTSDSSWPINPFLVALTADYFFDAGSPQDMNELLTAALNRRSVLDQAPELHYELARYYGFFEEPERERSTLQNALSRLEQEEQQRKEGREPLWLTDAHRSFPFREERRSLVAEADVLVRNRLGEIAYGDRRLLRAEELFSEAINRYEQSRNHRLLGSGREYGEIYSNLADIWYYQGRDLPDAYDLFEQAQMHGYSPPVLTYKKGYINYNLGGTDRLEQALRQFYESSGENQEHFDNPNLLFSQANVHFRLGDYRNAEGFFLHLADLLKTREQSVTKLLPEEREDHRALLTYLSKVHNNLGVTLYRLSGGRQRDPRFGRALANLAAATTYYDMLVRDRESLASPVSGKSGELMALSNLNSRLILYPGGQAIPGSNRTAPEPGEEIRIDEPVIYEQIPKDFTFTTFTGAPMAGEQNIGS